MDLDFSEEQEVLRAMVRSLCVEHCSIELVRAMEDDPVGCPTDLWKQLAEVGLLGILIPESLGGAGQGMLDAVIVHEELGRALAPVPAFHSSVVGARTLLLGGDAAQQEEWLPRIAAGEAIFSVAWLEAGRGFGPGGILSRAEPQSGGFSISGEKRHVAFAAAATRLVVLARTGEGPLDIGLFLVDPNGPGVQLEQTKSLASDTQYDVRFEEAPAELVGTSGGWAIWNEVMHDAAIVLGATAMGGCERAHEITTQYAKDRKQFDKPLGAFQAISHYLADAITRIDGGKVLVYEAAWMRDQGRDVGRLGPMAKLFACDTYRDTTAKCQQVWGGVGFSVEYDIQLYFRRAKQLQLSWWDAPYLEELIATHALDN
jgi:alkylation response protein AidB-like acyl-CoA dehydrogenase